MEPSHRVQPTAAQAQPDAAGRLYRMIAGQWAACVVRTVAELSVMDAVDDDGSKLGDLAAVINCDRGGLRRLLRACQALELVDVHSDADDEAVVRITDAGRLLRDDSRGSLKALARLQGTPGVWALWGALPDAVRAGTSTAPTTLGAPLFEFLRDHPGEGAVFARAMRDLTGLVEADAARAIELGPDADVVDVGGGTGGFLAALLAGAPTARGTVLDTAETIAQADASALPPDARDRMRFSAGDFFAQVPPADWYVLKSVLSDWGDDDAVRVLRTCRRAARPDTTLLVVEQLVGAAPAGQPDIAALMDMTLLALTTGGSRELAEYDRLAEAGGWRRTDAQPAAAGYAFVQLVPAD